VLGQGERKVNRIDNERVGKGKLQTGGNQMKVQKKWRSIETGIR
jgi:hypothetical protein